MGGRSCGNCCVGKCINIIGRIKDFFSGSKGSSSGGRTDSYDVNTADLETTVRVQHALTEFRTDTQDRSEKLENEVIKESREFLDEFLDDIRKYNKIRYGNRRLNINLSHIERENRKTEDEIHGFIVKRVIKRISLDDSECAEILKMDAGDAKTKKFDGFYKKILKEAVLELEEVLRNAMEKQTDMVEDKIQQRIDGIMDIYESKVAEFEKIQTVKQSGEVQIEQEQIRLAHHVALCEYALEQLYK